MSDQEKDVGHNFTYPPVGSELERLQSLDRSQRRFPSEQMYRQALSRVYRPVEGEIGIPVEEVHIVDVEQFVHDSYVASEQLQDTIKLHRKQRMLNLIGMGVAIIAVAAICMFLAFSSSL